MSLCRCRPVRGCDDMANGLASKQASKARVCIRWARLTCGLHFCLASGFSESKKVFSRDIMDMRKVFLLALCLFYLGGFDILRHILDEFELYQF